MGIGWIFCSYLTKPNVKSKIWSVKSGLWMPIKKQTTWFELEKIIDNDFKTPSILFLKENDNSRTKDEEFFREWAKRDIYRLILLLDFLNKYFFNF